MQQTKGSDRQGKSAISLQLNEANILAALADCWIGKNCHPSGSSNLGLAIGILSYDQEHVAFLRKSRGESRGESRLERVADKVSIAGKYDCGWARRGC
jgi:hypothetical protein